jgi:hypothetical protein
MNKLAVGAALFLVAVGGFLTYQLPTIFDLATIGVVGATCMWVGTKLPRTEDL